ncbi:MAG: hypothetical protein E7012_05115 [Alphaproteobacteria bacterium]|nr:hypothetical protein [Alphaproteobacteria bacterium]
MYRIVSCFIIIFFLVPHLADAAGISDYKDTFRINLEEDILPSITDLEISLDKEHDYYEPKYHSIWELQSEYDADFYAKATTYGINEKRLKWDEEDMLLQYLQSIPESMYQYIGPQLFEVPNMSEKILNMPGIKETKNKFPTRIAHQLKDIENLEFMSPAFYMLLMPEVWPDYNSQVEIPQMTPYYPKVKYDADFYAAMKELVPPQDYMLGRGKRKLGKSDMRTIKPDANSLITAADIEAVARTLPLVEEWYQSEDHAFQLSKVSILLFNYEYIQTPDVAPAMRELVNPCARLVQKARILGIEQGLALKVAKEGFSLNEWAYTCDKSIKAYRLSGINISLMQAIRMYKQGLFDEESRKIAKQSQGSIFSTAQALISAYQSPISDVMEMRKKRKLFDDTLKQTDYRIGGITIRIE